MNEEIKDTDVCDTPGQKIRSDGKGKGEAFGDGHGPIGVPKKESESEK